MERAFAYLQNQDQGSLKAEEEEEEEWDIRMSPKKDESLQFYFLVAVNLLFFFQRLFYLQLLFQMIQGLISVGFGNSSGKISTIILQENFQKVERFGIKVQINLPKLKSKTNGQLDLSHFNTMMAQRRNEAVFKSFLRNEDEDEIFDLHDTQDYAQQRIQSLVQELNTISVLKQQLKAHKFMDETNESDAVARDYLAQFNNDLTKALQTYKQRKEIVKKFADKNKIPEHQAMSILKENGYNAQLFEY